MKKIMALIAVALLAGCSEGVEQVQFNALPDELKDCKIYDFRMSSGARSLTVVRCPNSTVSTKTGGKYPQQSITIDGVTYERKDQ